MAGINKSNLGSKGKDEEEKKTLFEKLLGGKDKPEEKPKKVIKPTVSAKMGNTALKGAKISTATPAKSPLKKDAAKAAAAPTAVSKSNLAQFKAGQDVKNQLEVLHSKTHQDLINAAYKAAETLKIAPYVLLRAAGWGNFTDDRGKKYNGKAIDELEGLDAAQKKALKDVLGL